MFDRKLEASLNRREVKKLLSCVFKDDEKVRIHSHLQELNFVLDELYYEKESKAVFIYFNAEFNLGKL